ncbi:hypothetical protein BGX28_001610 [Mortierella sp. GBA30]|nr:hypothetical protein BGX28_001610 [Mortierella sp. GBA30]
MDENVVPSHIELLPLELLANIVQYLTRADDLRDHLNLAQTCRNLYTRLWADDSKDMWQIVWRELYDDPVTTKCQEGNNQSSRSLRLANIYKALIKERMEILRLTRVFAKQLMHGRPTHCQSSKIARDAGQYRGRCKGSDSTTTRVERELLVMSLEGRMDLIKALVDIAKDLGDKNVFWVQSVSTPGFWSYAIEQWFVKSRPRSLHHAYQEPRMLCRIFDILATIATTDPHILIGLYCNKFNSFHCLRGLLFRDEDPSLHELFIETMQLSWFSYSLCQVFFMVLFCGPTIALRRNHTVPWREAGLPQHRLLPSWFNLGERAEVLKPIPLIPPYHSGPKLVQEKKLRQLSCDSTTRYAITGPWSGYYAYQLFNRDVSSDEGMDDNYSSDDGLSDGEPSNRSGMTQGQEYAARGLKLDGRMSIQLVEWTTDSLQLGQCDRCISVGPRQGAGGSAGSSPFYLSCERDAEAFKSTDFAEERPGLDSAHDNDENDEDNLEVRGNWGHQRVFSGRGEDAIGKFGIRGLVSERSGLVRMVKCYFSPEQLDAVRDRLLFEFGSEPYQLAHKPRADLLLWYYRGHVDPEGEGPGIVGIWYAPDHEVSGPFWMYRLFA